MSISVTTATASTSVSDCESTGTNASGGSDCTTGTLSTEASAEASAEGGGPSSMFMGVVSRIKCGESLRTLILSSGSSLDVEMTSSARFDWIFTCSSIFSPT